MERLSTPPTAAVRTRLRAHGDLLAFSGQTSAAGTREQWFWTQHTAAEFIRTKIEQGEMLIWQVPLDRECPPDLSVGDPSFDVVPPAPYVWTLNGRGSGFDGVLWWRESVVVSGQRLPPGQIPVEIGTTEPATTLFHLRRGGGLARWCVGSDHLIVLCWYPTTGRALPQPGESLAPTSPRSARHVAGLEREIGSPLSEAFLHDLAEVPVLSLDIQHSASTQRAYESDMRALNAYLQDRGLPTDLPVHPVAVCAFLAAEARPDARLKRSARSTTTIERRVAAIRHRHLNAHLADPTTDLRVRATMTAIRRRFRPGDGAGRRRALTRDELSIIVDAIDSVTLAGLRDAALLQLGWATALARSELVALDVENLTAHGDGWVISTGRTGSGLDHDRALITIDGEPANALNRWLSASAIDAGPIFRRIRRGDRLTEARLAADSVSLIVKHRAENAGLDADAISAHSLRSGGIHDVP